MSRVKLDVELNASPALTAGYVFVGRMDELIILSLWISLLTQESRQMGLCEVLIKVSLDPSGTRQDRNNKNCKDGGCQSQGKGKSSWFPPFNRHSLTA